MANDFYIDEEEDLRHEEYPTEEEDEYETGICPNCSGSGEGMYDGSICGYCHGHGER